MAGENIQILEDSNFKEIITTSEIPVLIDFGAERCAPCRMIAPLIEEVAAEYKDKITVAKFDIDKNQVTPSELKILSIPTLIIFKEGKEIERTIGFQTKKELFALVEKHL